MIQPLTAILPQRELEICKRLRAFREGKKIARTRFAVVLGIGGERLASYEAGRVPVRYEVFRLVSQHFFINPLWLATGDGGPDLGRPFDDAKELPLINQRELFSLVYDRYFADSLSVASLEANRAAEGAIDSIRMLTDNPDAVLRWSEKFPARKEELQRRISELQAKLEKHLAFNAKVRAKVKKLMKE